MPFARTACSVFGATCQVTWGKNMHNVKKNHITYGYKIYITHRCIHIVQGFIVGWLLSYSAAGRPWVQIPTRPKLCDDSLRLQLLSSVLN